MSPNNSDDSNGLPSHGQSSIEGFHLEGILSDSNPESEK
jgi:hypothetical protein